MNDQRTDVAPDARCCPAAHVAAWLPLLIPPAVVAAVYLARAAGWDQAISKQPHEAIALCLLSAAVAVAVKGLLVQRDRFYLILGALCLLFLLREIHFPGAKRMLYGGVAVIGVWAALWRKDLLGALVGKARGRWLVVTVWAYVLALLVQRRAMRFLPDEENIHVELEEVLENIGHLFLLILGLL